MKKYEYITFQCKITDDEMNKLGEYGWELVSHTAVVYNGRGTQYYVFKREKKPDA